MHTISNHKIGWVGVTKAWNFGRSDQGPTNSLCASAPLIPCLGNICRTWIKVAILQAYSIFYSDWQIYCVGLCKSYPFANGILTLHILGSTSKCFLLRFIWLSNYYCTHLLPIYPFMGLPPIIILSFNTSSSGNDQGKNILLHVILIQYQKSRDWRDYSKWFRIPNPGMEAC